MKKLIKETFWFGISGVLGFIVDTFVLYGLRASLGPFIARAISFVCAVITTWLFNRSITFKRKQSGLNKKQEFISYLTLMLAGGAVNYGIYSWLIVAYTLVLEHPIIGVAAGSVAGMVVNLLTSKLLIFRKDKVL